MSDKIMSDKKKVTMPADMLLSNLSQFAQFDLPAFMKGKIISVVECKPWVDFDTKAELGTKVKGIIVSDNTEYDETNGKKGSNRYKKIDFKVNKKISVPDEAIIEPVGAIAKIWGEYQNCLSITCDDIKVLGFQNPISITSNTISQPVGVPNAIKKL